jgi:hypothetical protein
MSEVKIEQLQSVLKTFGLEDEDFQKLANENLEDTTPYIQKMQAHIKESILTDPEVIEGIVRPYKDAPIGKENQLKKEVRKYFGLQVTEDELKKTKFEDLLKRGVESRQTSVNADTEKLQQTIAQLMEEKEAIEASIPVKIQEVETQYVSRLKEKETAEALISMAATEVPQVPKENIPMFIKALTGYANAEGHKITMDDAKNVKVFDKDGLPIKDVNGHIIKAKDYIKSFANGIVSNVAPKPTNVASPSLAAGSKYEKYLSSLGKGFNN